MKTSIALLAGAAMLSTLPVFAQGPGGPGPGPGMDGPRGPGFGRHEACIMQALDLDESQQTAWESIQSTLHETMQDLARQRRDLARQRREALAAATPDPTTVGRLTISEHELGEQMRAARTKAHSDFAAVLRPDQREKFQDLAGLRQACGQRHGRRGRGLRGPGDCPGCPFGPPEPGDSTVN